MNYGNSELVSTYATKLKKIKRNETETSWFFLFNGGRLSHSRPLLRKINALNVSQINLYQRLNFMHQINNQETPKIFNDLIKKPVHKYPTDFSKSNFCLKCFP